MVNEAKQKPPRRYEKMRDSGVAWIGMVPEGWTSFLLGQLVKQVKNKNVLLQERNLLSLSYGKIKRKDIETAEGLVPASYDGYNIIEKGDIVLRLTDLQNDHTSLRVGLATERGIITSAYLTLRPLNSVFPAFLYYALHTFDVRKGFYGMGAGVRQGLKYDEIRQIKVVLPALIEQHTIANFLDKKCSEIDAIIADAKASIEEYKAWKASIIYEAVTKGLDPHAKMKDSGVEWIGKIPKHWGTTALKRICKRISDGSHYSPPTTAFGLPYVTAGDIHGKGINYTKCRTISKSDFDLLVKTNCQPHLGDVLLVKDGATTGRVGLMTDDGPCVLLSSVAMLTPNDGISSEYLMYLLESDVFQYQIKKTMAGSAMPRTTLSKLMVYTAILCPFDEQVEIVNYLNAKCSHIEDLISEKLSLISDLESYKKSLIYEVVTGKRKVC